MSEKGGTKNSDRDERAFKKKLLIGLVVLACLTPLGIILPKIAGGGEAWGEWGPEYLHKALGYLPEGLQKSIGVWHAPVSGYALPRAGDSLAVADRVVCRLRRGRAAHNRGGRIYRDEGDQRP